MQPKPITPLTLEQAKSLTRGTTLHHTTHKNADGTPQRWKVTSVTTWKTRPGAVRIGLKHGLRFYDTITENDLHLLGLPE